MDSITPAELDRWLKSESPPLLLDVRQPEEFAVASLPGAVVVPLDQLPARLSEPDGWRTEEVVVYCHHGMRSAHAIGWLAAQGFSHLRNLTGGIDRWSLEVDSETPRY